MVSIATVSSLSPSGAPGVFNGPDRDDEVMLEPRNGRSSLPESSNIVQQDKDMFSSVEHELPPGYSAASFGDIGGANGVSSITSSAKRDPELGSVLSPENVKELYLADILAENKDEESSSLPKSVEQTKSRNDQKRSIMICFVALALLIAIVVVTVIAVSNKKGGSNSSAQTGVSNSSTQTPVLNFSDSSIALVSLEASMNADGRGEVFGLDSNMRVYVRKQLEVGGVRWSGWTSLNGQFAQIAAVLEQSTGKLKLFGVALGGGGSVWTTSQVDPNGTAYTEWLSMGGTLKQIAVTAQLDGGSLVAGVDANNGIVINAGSKPDNWWPVWCYSKCVQSVGVGLFSDGTAQAFYLSMDGKFWYTTWQNIPLSGQWIGLQNMSNVASQIVVQSSNGTAGRPYAFGINYDNSLLYNEPIGKGKDSGGWYPYSGWKSLGGWVQQIKTVYNAGQITVFAIGNDTEISMISQVLPSMGWGSWQRTGYKAKQFAVLLNALGCVDLFGIHPNGALWTTTVLCS